MNRPQRRAASHQPPEKVLVVRSTRGYTPEWTPTRLSGEFDMSFDAPGPLSLHSADGYGHGADRPRTPRGSSFPVHGLSHAARRAHTEAGAEPLTRTMSSPHLSGAAPGGYGTPSCSR